MVQYHTSPMDLSFAALADPTRRGVIEVLGQNEATISDLSQRFGMTLTGIKKHVGVLEQAGFVVTEKVGRVRLCRLGLKRLEAEAAWIETYRRTWEARFAALDQVVGKLIEEEQGNGTAG